MHEDKSVKYVCNWKNNLTSKSCVLGWLTACSGLDDPLDTASEAPSSPSLSLAERDGGGEPCRSLLK